MRINKYKIKEAMARNGIDTQTDLAKRLDITKNQLSVMLSDKFNPIKSNILKLCENLDISPLEIIYEETKQKDKNLLVAEPITNYLVKKVLTTSSNIKVLELFAGAGGLAIGLEKAGLETVALIEIDKDCCNTLRQNRPQWNVINEDVRNIDFKKYKVDVVTGGFPCQAFSYAGKKLGFEDTRGTLFYEFARCIRDTKPLLFMAENVRGLVSHDNGRTFKTIIDILTELGYKVQWKLLNTINYSVAQKRERVIIIGTLPCIEFQFPEKEKKVKVLSDALKNVPKSIGVQYSANKRKVLDLVPPGGCWRSLPIDVQKSYMGRSFYSGGGRTGMARRISWDEPCLTLTCSPSQKQTERCHPDETRPFTVREYARIQSFPDSWDFSGGIGSKYKQIGNAVPPELAHKLGLQIYKAVSGLEQNNIDIYAGSKMAIAE